MSELNNTTGREGTETIFKFRQESLFWGSAVVLLFLYLWSPALGQEELRFGEILREMQVSGNLFHGAVNWQIVLGCSLLNCWISLVFVKLFGLTAFGLRFPAVLAALGGLYALRLLGKNLFDKKTALLSSWMFLGSAGFLMTGRMAAPDMACCTSILMAAAWLFSSREKWGFCSYLGFYLFCLGGVFFKDLAALILPAMLVAGLLITGNSWKKHLRWKNLLALLIAVLLAGAYFYLPVFFSPAPQQTFALKAESSCFVIAYGFFRECLLHPGEIGSGALQALENLLIALMPWTLMLPVGIAGFLKHRNELSSPAKVLFAGVCVTLLFYCFFKESCSNLLFNTVPFIFLFSAAGFCQWGEFKWNKAVFSAAYYILIICASLCIGTVIGYPLWERLARCTPPAALVLAPVAAGILAWSALFVDHKKNTTLGNHAGLPHPVVSVILAGTLLSGAFFSVLLPVVTDFFDSQRRFFTPFRRIEAHLGCRVVSFMESVPAACLFYSRIKHAVPRTDDLGELAQKFPGSKVLIVFKERRDICEKFSDQCRKYGVAPEKPYSREDLSRWSAPDSREEKYISYLITLPSGKENGQK